jgi:hypothetical protein
LKPLHFSLCPRCILAAEALELVDVALHLSHR